MPKIPESQHIQMDAVAITNAVRNESSEYYKSMVPYANPASDSIKEIGRIFMTYDAVRNEYLTNLYDRIARVDVTSRLYENPLRRFKKGMLENGETIEEVYVALAKPFQYNPEVASKKVFERVIPDVRAAFHHLNFQKFYKETIQDMALSTAFLSWAGVENLIAKMTDSLYTSNNFDEFQVMKYMVALHALRGTLNPIPVGGIAADNMKSIAATIKSVSNTFEFMSTKWNFAGVPTYSDKSRQILLVNAKFDAIMDVEVLASSFNMSKAEFMGQRILVDSFGSFNMDRLDELFAGDPNYHHFTPAELEILDQIPAVLVDVDWFQIYDRLLRFTEIYNPEGLYWNYFLHVWKIFSVSPFANNALFTIGKPTITSVTILNTDVQIAPGQVVQLYVQVVGSDFAPSAVEWSTTNPGLTVTPAGELRVLPGTTPGSYNVTAVSTWDSTKSSTIAVTVL